jgi:hypothetical protein
MFLNNYNKKRIGVILLEAIYIISALIQRLSRCIAVLAYQGDPFYRTLSVIMNN